MQSTARVARHPIHAMLVHFPVAFWIASFIADIIASVNDGSHAFGYYLALAGCIGAGIAAIPGMIDMAGTILPRASPRVRKIALSHAMVQVVALVFWIASVLLRPAPELISSGVWIASTVGFGLLLVGTYIGGRLVYEFRVGVSEGIEIHHRRRGDGTIDLAAHRAAKPERDPRRGIA